MKKYKEVLGKKGISMFFALLLFLFMTVLGINLLNAVNAKGNNIMKELNKEQTLLYISSAYDVINQMICDGKFYNVIDDKHAKKAETTLSTQSPENNQMQIAVTFESTSPSRLTAKMVFKYQSQTYQITCYYQKVISRNEYLLKRCEGLEGGTN